MFEKETVDRMKQKQAMGVSIRQIAKDEGLEYHSVWRFLTGRSYKDEIKIVEGNYEMLQRMNDNMDRAIAILEEMNERNKNLNEKIDLYR